MDKAESKDLKGLWVFLFSMKAVQQFCAAVYIYKCKGTAQGSAKNSTAVFYAFFKPHLNPI